MASHRALRVSGLVLALAAGALACRRSSAPPPAGVTALADLAPLRDAFNSDAARTRLLVLLSPT